MKLVYVAGPYRSENAWAVEANIRNAEEETFALAQLGYVGVCVHSMYRYFDGTLTAEYWLAATLEVMKRCDAVLLLPGWAESAGSVKEKAAAEALGIPVFTSLRTLCTKLRA